MSSQIYVNGGPPLSLLFTLLEKTCHSQTDKCFIITLASYKKGILTNVIEEFINEIKKYYKKSKMFYVTRKITYKNFLTIIRQLCNLHNIIYTNEIKYDKSTYEIKYQVFLCKSIM